MSASAKVAALQRRFSRLKASLRGAGLVVQGSILRRMICRQDSHKPGRMRHYGPYYQWTRKRDGRTVIQNLTAAQAKAYGRAICENQRLEKIITQMRDVSLKLLELTTRGVRKRNRPKEEGRPLS